MRTTTITSTFACGPTRYGRWYVLAWLPALVAITTVTPGRAAAAPEGRGSATADAEQAGPADELDRGVPRSAMFGYIKACRDSSYQRAARYFDLRRFDEAERPIVGPQLARKLKIVLDQHLWIEWELLSDDPTGDPDDGLPPSFDRVGAIQTARGATDILLERVSRSDGELIWKIAGSTVAAIPALYGEFGYGPLGELLPVLFFEVRVLDIELWQWIGLLVVVVVAVCLSWLVTTILLRVVRPWLPSERRAADHVAALTAGPVRLMLGAVVFSALSLLLSLPVPAQSLIASITKVLTIVAVTWLLLRIIDIAAEFIDERWRSRGETAALAVLPLGRRTVKVFVGVLAVLAALQNVGVNVTGVIAGLGVGGLAVALAAQKTLENLFGGVTLITDQPVRVGDFCRFAGRVGTVEDVGLRSTRIRTLDRTVVTIPNAEFSSLHLENFGRRDRIWLHPAIGLRYETTPDQLRFVLVEIKKMLLAHPKIHPDPARVRFSGFGAYSLDLDIFAYVLTMDYNEFLAVREDVLLRIMDIVDASGTGFAFPSQTMYLGRDDGLDAEKSRAAEAQVAAWRAERNLCLPDFPRDRAAALERLDYPPEGSPGRR